MSEQNFRRISRINILLVPPLFIIFAWPYYVLGIQAGLPELLLFAGSAGFSLSFTLTILHGHVTIAVGAPHRYNYHDWLRRHRWSYGLLIKPIFFSTRLRLFLLILSAGILISGLVL
ncbi:hypothetical protein QA596_09665 [Balneolales bacterium ANBcel1]|nr:hypothetical protein [Balneolales bacterium ANBcel1]